MAIPHATFLQLTHPQLYLQLIHHLLHLSIQLTEPLLMAILILWTNAYLFILISNTCSPLLLAITMVTLCQWTSLEPFPGQQMSWINGYLNPVLWRYTPKTLNSALNSWRHTTLMMRTGPNFLWPLTPHTCSHLLTGFTKMTEQLQKLSQMALSMTLAMVHGKDYKINCSSSQLTNCIPCLYSCFSVLLIAYVEHLHAYSTDVGTALLLISTHDWLSLYPMLIGSFFAPMTWPEDPLQLLLLTHLTGNNMGLTWYPTIIYVSTLPEDSLSLLWCITTTIFYVHCGGPCLLHCQRAQYLCYVVFVLWCTLNATTHYYYCTLFCTLTGTAILLPWLLCTTLLWMNYFVLYSVY